MKYGEDLSNSACLKLPSGEEWQVEMTRCNGNSVFQVCICDRTATEIEYPLTMAPGMEKKGQEEDDVSTEILEDSPPYPKKREKSPSTCPPSNKKRRTIRSLKAEYARIQNDVGGSSTKQKCLERSVEHLGEFRQLNNDEKARALSCADGFTSEEAHFKIVMQPSYIHLNIIGIPPKFLRENNIKENKHATNVTLRISTGKTWSVKFTYSMSNAKFRNGWLAFVKDNCLKVGDVCVFILMKDINLSFQVEIFRAPGFLVLQGDGREGAIHVKNSMRSIKVESDCGIAGKNKGSETCGEVAKLGAPGQQIYSEKIPSLKSLRTRHLV